MPAYNNNTPLATQPINQTQAPIQTNFATLQTSFDINHVDFASADFGKHKWVTFPAQNPVDPQAAINNPDIGLYNAVYNGNEELWYRNSTNVVTDIPFTASLYNTTGWTYLPSGIILQWGAVGLASPALVPFSIPFPNQCFQVVVTPTSANPVVVSVSNLTTINFTATANSGSVQIRYFAIGY